MRGTGWQNVIRAGNSSMLIQCLCVHFCVVPSGPQVGFKVLEMHYEYLPAPLASRLTFSYTSAELKLDSLCLASYFSLSAL